LDLPLSKRPAIKYPAIKALNWLLSVFSDNYNHLHSPSFF